MHRTAKQIHNLVKQANHILLVPHQNPDGDALGSVSAFMSYLNKHNIIHSAFSLTKPLEKFSYLPHSQKISNKEDVWQDASIDMVIIFDSGDLNYDHNLVIENASSTAEVLFNYFKYNKINIDKKMATALLTGIITDTDNFTNSATSVSSLSAASELIRTGGDLNMIKNALLKDKTVSSLILWGVVLTRLTMDEKSSIVYTYLTKDDLKTNHINENEAEGMANFLNNLSEGKAGLILKETEEGKIKGSFRTTHDDVDVSAYAMKLGGGGHKKAAGFTIEGPMDIAIGKILDTVKNTDIR